MSRFDSMFEEDDLFEDIEKMSEEAASVPVGTIASLGAAEWTYSGTQMTETEYECYVLHCQTPKETCTQPIMFFIDPSFKLHVGSTHGIPKELAFTDLPHEVKSLRGKKDSIWAHHALASNRAVHVKCPCCGYMNKVVLSDNGDLITGDYDPKNLLRRPIPRNRVYYVDTALDEWKIKK
ncbi:MAG: hypothetical protein HRT64_12540 [Erythrobacter sp.]|nr:hypothetical protein [Erythrobacter sp.]